MNGTRLPGQQSVRRAVDVLLCFDAHRTSLTAAEVGAAVDINRTTAWRYLQTLTSTGLVRELGDGRFALGGRTVRLAEAYTSQWGELGAVAGAALVRLRDAAEETAALHVRQGWSRVVVRQVESRQELHRTYRDLGEPISLLVGAPSLAILAAFDRPDRAAYLDAHLPEPADRAAVEEEIGHVGAQGYAVSRGSRAPGVASVAAPVRDGRGVVLGALNVTGPAHRFTTEAVQAFATEVTGAAGWVESQVRDLDITAVVG